MKRQTSIMNNARTHRSRFTWTRTLSSLSENIPNAQVSALAKTHKPHVCFSLVSVKWIRNDLSAQYKDLGFSPSRLTLSLSLITQAHNLNLDWFVAFNLQTKLDLDFMKGRVVRLIIPQCCLIFYSDWSARCKVIFDSTDLFECSHSGYNALSFL